MSAWEKYMAELPEELMERLTELEQQLATKDSFIEDWNQIFPDEDPREVKAKLTEQDKLLRKWIEAFNGKVEMQVDGENKQFLLDLVRESADATG